MESGTRLLTSTDINTLTTTKTDTIGAVGATPDGRRYAYTSFGGTATINAGSLVVSPAKTANSNGLAIPTQLAANLAASSRNLIVTNGTTAVTQDQFADGYLEVISTNAGSFAVRIAGNTAAGSGAAITLTLEPQGLNAALVAGTDTVNLTVSPYANVINSTTQSAVAGVAPVAVAQTSTTSYYGWVQTQGHAFVVASSATKGQGVTQDSVSAGAIKTSSAFTDAVIGFAKETAVSGYAPVELDIR